jgi:DNA-binding XRE family transcriptional regulator
MLSTDSKRFKPEVAEKRTALPRAPQDKPMQLAAVCSAAQPAQMPMGAQIRAARALLGWSAARLAEIAGTSERTIGRAERSAGVPHMHTATLERIAAALRAQGIEFRNDQGGLGVFLRQSSASL